MLKNLIVKGAREHNLKNIDLEIPRDKLVVITGLSGSGKSSLAFDTIYAEGQRRYVESLSAYARQFLGLMEKPDVDYIEGLSPAISIEQRSASHNPRSTVGTVTEIYDYLRLLFAHIGTPYCYNCGRPITQQTVQQIVDTIMEFPERTKIQVLSPIVRGRKGEFKTLFEDVQRQGYVRIRVNGEMYEVTDPPELEKHKKHSIEVVVDRLVVKPEIEKRLADSLETALKLADGLVLIDIIDGEEKLFSEKLSCAYCNISYEEITPRMFSFNSPFGACPECDGLGTKMELDPALIIRDPSLSIYEGAISPWGDPTGKWHTRILRKVAKLYNFSLSTPFKELTEKQQNAILYGVKNKKFLVKWENQKGGHGEFFSKWEGIIPNLQRRYRETNSDGIRRWIEGYMASHDCPECNGARLRKESLSILIRDKNITQITQWSIKNAIKFFAELELTEREEHIAHQILKEIRERLSFLQNVGLNYLTLDRTAGTLSGGEAQRIRLATQIGSSLMGVLYILDEPSIGLHQRDNKRLLDTLIHLRDLGNTVIVVEHDKETMHTADHIIDLGPGAGIHGGNVVCAGTPKEVEKSEDSLTGKYLSGQLKIPAPEKRREGNGFKLTLVGASQHNLKNIEVDFPLGKFICVTGVSGSGKSTLINETLFKILANHFYRRSSRVPGKYKDIIGLDNIDKVINIDQSPIGRTPRSNPATYTSVFTPIRELFSQLSESKMRGYKPGRFSFNVKGGRCKACSGDGIIKIEMHFLPDVYVPCEVCGGKRYNRETLEIRYKGKNIYDVLEMTVEEAFDFFHKVPKIRRKLKTLKEVGLGYIHLGQPATTLSGGEAQRVKLAKELSKRSTGQTLYILDEPTTGLHFEDIKMLLRVLNKFVDKGNTVIVIEHNLDVIKTADHIIDLGPEGGDDGGSLVAVGTPEEVSQTGSSWTGKFLQEELGHDLEG